MPPPRKKRNCAQGEEGEDRSGQVSAQINQQIKQEIVVEQETDDLVKGNCIMSLFIVINISLRNGFRLLSMQTLFQDLNLMNKLIS